MTNVNINGCNHQVEVDCDNPDLTYVVERAQKLWDDTKPTGAGPGPAYGYSAERRPSAKTSPFGMGGYGHEHAPEVDR